MKPPKPSDNTDATDPGDVAADETHETSDDVPLARPTPGDHLSAITSEHTDPAVLAVLGVLSSVDDGERPSAWSVLTDVGRLRAVADTGLLEPGPHSGVDQIIGLTIEAVGIPNAALNMVTDTEQTSAGTASRDSADDGPPSRPLADSLCVYPVMTGTPLIIDDMAEHPVLANHSTAQSGEVASYIGIPIADDEGHAVGTLCAWDSEPRHWSSGEVQIMTDLADVLRGVIFDK